MHVTDEMVEAAAKAMAELSLEPEHGETWDGVHPEWKENYRTQAIAALNAAFALIQDDPPVSLTIKLPL